jgi:hypothetical protein
VDCCFPSKKQQQQQILPTNEDKHNAHRTCNTICFVGPLTTEPYRTHDIYFRQIVTRSQGYVGKLLRRKYCVFAFKNEISIYICVDSIREKKKHASWEISSIQKICTGMYFSHYHRSSFLDVPRWVMMMTIIIIIIIIIVVSQFVYRHIKMVCMVGTNTVFQYSELT